MNVYRFSEPPMNASCYVCLEDDSGILIDPCVTTETVFKRLGHNIKITHILITHGHFDHIFRLDEWKEATNAEVIVSEDDECMLSSPTMNASSLFGVMRVECKTKPDTLLSGGEILFLGDICVNVYPARGHTQGGLLFLSENHLFSGDTLFYGSYGRFDLYGGDPEELRDTLSSMKRFDGKGITLCPGHGEECPFDAAYRAIN